VWCWWQFILDDSNENLSYDSSSGSDYEIFDADMSDSESGTSDSGSENHEGIVLMEEEETVIN
jgi:hypothetical protein